MFDFEITTQSIESVGFYLVLSLQYVFYGFVMYVYFLAGKTWLKKWQN